MHAATTSHLLPFCAGEAGVPFFYRAGSEFEELYVGVGSRRMRALFAVSCMVQAHSACQHFVSSVNLQGPASLPTPGCAGVTSESDLKWCTHAALARTHSCSPYISTQLLSMLTIKSCLPTGSKEEGPLHCVSGKSGKY